MFKLVYAEGESALLLVTVWCMARCVQISDYFSVEPQARFLNFTIYLVIGNRQI